MTQIKDLYCDIGFWKILSKELSSIKPTTDAEEQRRTINLYDWYGLFRRSKKKFDIRENEFVTEAEKDVFLKQLWKQSSGNARLLDFSPGAIASMCTGASQMNAKMYNSLYLTEDSHVTQAGNVGVMNICSKDLLYSSYLFRDSGPSIRKGTKHDWFQILKSAKADQNCNSMIIVDNYIFKDVEDNLYRILDTLLPQKLGTTFYLSLFSLDGSRESEVERFKEQLDTEICKIRPDLTVSLEVFGCCADDFHDRGIITNYLWIEIGAGFNIIKKGVARKTTNPHVIYPMIVPEDRIRCSSEGYWNIIEDAKRYLKIRNAWSNNRLLRKKTDS